MTDQPLEVTTGAEWRRRREEGQVVQLPTGRVARLRPISLAAFARQGKIPNLLIGLVSRLVLSSEETVTVEGEEGISQMTALLAVVCREAFMEPEVLVTDEGAEPEELADTQVMIEDLDWIDQVFVLNWVNAPAFALEPFRPEPDVDVPPLRTGKGNEPETEPDS